MTLNDYQQATRNTAIYRQRLLSGQWLGYAALGLAGEAGEVANAVKKVMRDNEGRLFPGAVEALKGELGDCLWYLARLCEELDLKLEDVAAANLEKLIGRKDRGTLTGSGDNR